MIITIVSLLPYQLQEIKPGLIPGVFTIPAAKNGIPGVLHIDDAKSNLYIRDGKTFPITHPAEEVANAIVNDYCTSQLQGSEEAKPALFWVFGKHSGADILKEFTKEVEEARKKQNVWFMRLVTLADDDWAKTGQHRMISDLQRHAAKSLGLVNKPWYQSPEPQEFVKCPACNSLVESGAAICYNCKHVVNKEKAAALGIKVA